ncbi:MAG: DNA polymerase/3'-5' exonuclease PolX [bacterium]|jgi:DNA polymerase (family 10)|nr:DNA polymerase/3'-5' exonuclease PolX [bacterium]MDD4558933.1 DNA polymerase/3'-5' exonuclease PolX [bacterium]
MNNEQVAEVLNDIAEILEIKGESKYRIRAYQQAARSIEFMPEDIEQVYHEGHLDDIPYIGKSIAAKVADVLEHGRSSYLEELEESIPPGIESLLQVPGIGPKTAVRLYQELGIDNIESLRIAAEEHRIQQLRGMGKKTEENILKGIKWLLGKSPRLPLGVAAILVERILEQLRRDPFVRNLVVVGSYRRMKPTVGDIDIMGTSDHPETVIDLFTALPDVDRIMAKGTTKATVLAENGLQIDLRIVPHESLGSLMQHFTGSKEHNVQLREYALSKGFSVSEYGITNIKTGWRIPCTTEEQVYSILELPYIPPEIRQGSGEIGAAVAGKLPMLVAQQDICGDLHTHSIWSDGRSSLEEMALAAEEKGYSYLAVTDHSPGLGIAHGLSVERLRLQWREIDDLNNRLEGITLLKGSEVDIRADGSLDLPDEILKELDIVLGAIHSGMRESSDLITERVIRAMRNPYLNILAHPTGRLIGSREPYDIDMEKVIKAATDLKVILEIDGTPDRLDLDGRHARRAKELNAKIAVSSDAHQVSGLNNMRFGVGTARRGWLEKRDVVNTWELKELQAFLNQHKGK